MTGAPGATGATAIVPVEATDGGVDSVAIPHAGRRQAHQTVGRRRRRQFPVLHNGQIDPGGARPGRRAEFGRAAGAPRQRVLVISTGSDWRRQARWVRSTSPTRSCCRCRPRCGRRCGRHRNAAERRRRSSRVAGRYAVDADLIITSGGVRCRTCRWSKTRSAARLPGGDHGVRIRQVAMQPGMPQGVGRVRCADHAPSRQPRSARWCR